MAKGVLRMRLRLRPILVLPPLNDLSLDEDTFSIEVEAGTPLANISGKTAGSLLAHVPNDGVFAFNEAQTEVLRGLAETSEGPLNGRKIVETRPGAPNSPKENTFDWTVTPQPSGAAPQLRNWTMQPGASTRSGHGGVSLARLMQTGGDAVDTWEIIGGSTSGITLNASNEIVPSSHGGFGGSSRSLTIRATNAHGSATATLTINPVADAYSVSKVAEVSSSGLGAASLKGTLGGKTVILAYGQEINHAPNANGDHNATYNFNAWNTHTGRIAVRSEFDDPELWTVTRIIRFTTCTRMDLSKVRPRAYLAATNASSDAQNAGQVRLLSGCSDITLTDIDCGAPADLAPLVQQWPSGIEVTQASNVAGQNIRIVRSKDGLRPGRVTDCLWEGVIIDSYCSNGFFSGGVGNSRNTYRDFIVVRAFRNPIDIGDHQDAMQSGGGVPTADYEDNTYENWRIYQADGNASMQGPFWDDVGYYNKAVTGYGQHRTTIRHVFSDTVKHMGPNLDAGNGWILDRMTNIRAAGRWIAQANPVNGSPGLATGYQNPQIEWNSAVTVTATASRCVAMTASASAVAGISGLRDNNVLLMDTDKLGALPSGVNASANDAAALEAYYEAAFVDPDTSDLDFPNMSAEEIDAAMRVKYSAKPGGTLDRGDGTFDGVFVGEGLLNPTA